jgi:hypothetical protein
MKKNSLCKALSALCVLTLCACGGDKDEDKSGDLPPLTGESRFLGELKKIKHPAAEAPAGAQTLRWDFSNKAVHTYDYDQRVIAVSFMPPFMQSEMTQEITGRGLMEFRSRGDGIADAVIRDVRARMTMKTEGKRPETTENVMPPTNIPGVKEDGTCGQVNPEQDQLIPMLLPLPAAPLEVGRSSDVPAEMPFNANGRVLPARGHHRITLTGYRTVRGTKCARLDVDTDISQLEIPPDMDGQYQFSVKGSSVLFFDPEKRRFVSATVAMYMQIRMKASPKLNATGKKSQSLPMTMYMSMKSDNLIRIDLKTGAAQ